MLIVFMFDYSQLMYLNVSHLVKTTGAVHAKKLQTHTKILIVLRMGYIAVWYMCPSYAQLTSGVHGSFHIDYQLGRILPNT